MENTTPKEKEMDLNAIATKDKVYFESGFKHQERRHEEWRENYSLYRSKITINRLTQRQSVNVPLMKETIKTILAKTDEAVDIVFEENNGDKQKEIFKNEYWKYNLNAENFDNKDIADKKQVLLYGISTIKLNLTPDRVVFELLEPFDVIIDRFADPLDIDNTAQYLCHCNIFQTIGQLKQNPHFDQDVVDMIELEYATAQGLIKNLDENQKQLMDKALRLSDLGLADAMTPETGEAVLQLKESHLKLLDPKTGEQHWYVRTTHNAKVLLFKPLMECMGIDFLPFVIWSEDIEKTDIYPDGVGDIVRTPNKVVNSWLSQLVENRTLRNFGMQFYDATASENFMPQTYEPTPWGWYGVPGDPNKIVKKVDVPDLSESLDEMQYLIGTVERATASTATEKGVKEQGQITLGQIKIMNENAMERITSFAKFYRKARQQLAEKWSKITEANADYLAPVKLYKKARSGKLYEQTITPEDWKSSSGYACKITSTAEQMKKNTESINKLMGIKTEFPNNQTLKKILGKKLLEIGELSPEEIQEVFQEEEQNLKNSAMTPTNPVDQALAEQNKALGVPAQTVAN